MRQSDGELFWASPECWLMLGTSHASRGAEPSKDKVYFHFLLECQNGNDCGPRSIKSSPEQIHIPTTNFGMLITLDQADTVRDFWGHVFLAGSPIRNKGFEGRPLFVFAGASRLVHHEQFISALIYAVVKCILLSIASSVGHSTELRFIQRPLQAKVPNIISNHLFSCSFAALPRVPQQLQALLIRRMSQNKRQQGWDLPGLASYLCKTYFFHLSPEDARSQYQLTDPILTEDGRVLCASWWASYVRLQPGSASGTQPVKSMHANGRRSALVASLELQAESPESAELRLADAGKVMGYAAFSRNAENPRVQRGVAKLMSKMLGGASFDPDARNESFSWKGFVPRELVELACESLQNQHDIAAELQRQWEERSRSLIQDLLERLTPHHKVEGVVMMGGCALNVQANQYIHDWLENSSEYKDVGVYIPPAPSDCGVAVGGMYSVTPPVLPQKLQYLGFRLWDEETLEVEAKKRGAQQLEALGGVRHLAELLA
ncbi:unnamed protein product, partial [Symbiodinium sp. KB8]